MWPTTNAKAPPPRPAAPAPGEPPGMTPARPRQDAPLIFGGFDCLAADPSFASQPPPTPTKGARDYPYIPAEGNLPHVPDCRQQACEYPGIEWRMRVPLQIDKLTLEPGEAA